MLAFIRLAVPDNLQVCDPDDNCGVFRAGDDAERHKIQFLWVLS